MTKAELIAVLSPPLIRNGNSPKDVQAVLETYTVPELQEMFRKQQSVSQQEVDQAILKVQNILGKRQEAARIQAEREADWIEFQVEQAMANESQRRAEAKRLLPQDRETLKVAAKTLRSFGINEANLNICRAILGPGFSQFEISQALASNALQLSPPGQQELDQWAAQDVEAHNQALLNTDPTTLRSEVRRETAERQTAVAQEQAARQLEAAKQRDQYRGYKPLPPEINSKAIKAAGPETLRNWMRLYGSYQITIRARGEN